MRCAGVGWAVAMVWIGFPLASGAQEALCGECHEDEAAGVQTSLHDFLECTDCHLGADSEDHPEGALETSCFSCHEEAVTEFESSVHGQVAQAEEEAWVGGCVSCHGEAHALRSTDDPESPVSRQKLAATCGRCHADPRMAERYMFQLVRPLEAYLSSVHARAVGEGREAANCGDCHGHHAIFAAVDPRSEVNHSRVPETCGQCHGEITETFSASVHGSAAAHGIRESPVCTDCHGEHHILSPNRPDSPTYPTNIPRMTCGRCHGDVRLSEKFGMPEDKVPTYADSYHGLASRSGSLTVANCASCHGVHDIRPSSDPLSHTHKDRLAETCGQCHPGAGARFAIGSVHVNGPPAEHVAVYWARRIYIWIILLTIGPMILHNALDFYRKSRNRPLRRHFISRPVTRERLPVSFRIAHGMLAASFVVLVYTGFALKYPESWWAEPLLQWEDRFALRGWIHRAAAVVMLAAGALHLWDLIAHRRLRALVADMRPGPEDLTEMKERLRYFFGRRPDPPPAAWVDYAEKIEYLAVVWGSVVMAVTGFILWFETLVLRWLPSWTADLATTIHLYEAILASLAIVVWHFYAVIFDPLVYPMDTAWITGRSAPARDALREGRSPDLTGEPDLVPPTATA